MKLYFGNLSPSIDDSRLKEISSEFGTTESSVVVRDRDTGTSRGFGFVEFANPDEANAAIAGLNGKEVDGKSLTVNEARPLKNRDAR